MKRFAMLFAFLVFVGLPMLQAQNMQITGLVTSSEDGNPLPGVSVIVKGTTLGTTTDADGHYVLNVPASATTLVFSFVGTKSQEIEIGGRKVIDVALQTDVIGLNEVVVVGYGVIRKEANTGSVGVIKENALKSSPETSLDRMLSGKVAGVQITSSTGQPGANTQVRIRGISSITSGNQPLYVVDGIPIMEGNQSYFTNSGNALSSINMDDVESISVLKDAAAASIYGSRAANGVILITTKSGKSGGKSNFTIRTSYGMETLTNENDYRPLNAKEYVTYWRDAITNAGLDPDNSSSSYYMPESGATGETTNWMDVLTRSGTIYNAEFTAQGGTDKTKSYFSGGYDKHEGIFYGVGFEKFQARTNVDHQLNNKLKIATKINGAYTKTDDIAMQSLYYVNPVFAMMSLSPLTKVKNEDGTYNLDDFGYWSNTNPRASAAYDKQWEKQYRINSNISLEYKILKNLIFKTTEGLDYTSGEGIRYWSDEADPTVTTGTLQSSRSLYRQLTTSNTLTYNAEKDKHSIQLLAGQEASDYYYNSYYIYSPDVDPQIPYPTTSTSASDQGDYGESANTLLSYFGIFYYNYDGKYYLQGSLRKDGSSRFGADRKWGTFYAASAAWSLSKENFLSSISQINELKLRASYGLSGNNQIGDYTQYGLYSSAEYSGNVYKIPSNPKNPELKWENNSEYNLALDFGFLNRISGTFEYYYRETQDMLLSYPLSYSSGFGSMNMNIGNVENRGYEFLLNYKVIQKDDLDISVGFNISHNSSKITNLGDQEEFIDGRIIHRKGEHLNSFYLYDYAGVNPANGEALWYNSDGKLTNVASAARRVIKGSPEAKFTGGFNTQISYKGISLDAFFEFKTGNQVLLEENRYFNSDGYWWYKNQAVTQMDYWKKPGDITRNPKPVLNNTSSSSRYMSSRWLQNGDYLRIKNITLSYMLPKKFVNMIKIENLKIYGSASNLYTWSGVDYLDPERGEDGIGFGIYPQTRKILFGLELTF